MPIGGAYFLNWRGLWQPSTTYNPLDAVGFNGLSYVCTVVIASTTSPDSDLAHWSLLSTMPIPLIDGGAAS